MGAVSGVASHFHERVREEALRTMGGLLIAAHAVKPPGVGEWGMRHKGSGGHVK